MAVNPEPLNWPEVSYVGLMLERAGMTRIGLDHPIRKPVAADNRDSDLLPA